MYFASAAQAPRWRDVYLASTARAVSACGDFLAATALALALQSRGAGGPAVAAVLLASTVPLVLVAPLGGRLADRLDSRLLLVTVGALQIGVCVLLAYTGHPAAMIALVAVLATGFAITQPTLAALIPDMVGREHLPKAMAISQTASSIGMLIGPAAAGVLVGQFGLRVPLLVDAATYLAIVAAGLLIGTRRGGKATEQPAAAGAAPAPAWSMRSDPLLRALVFAFAIAVGALSAINVADVFFVRETLHASETAYGLLMATWTGAMMIGSWVIARQLSTRADGAVATGLLLLLVGTSTVLLVAATAQHVIWLIPLWIIGGLINGGENVGANVMIARRVPAAVRGRAIGAFVGVINGANVVGYLLGGALLTVLSPRLILAGSGVAALTAVALCTPPVRRAIRRERAAQLTRPEPEPAPAPAAG